MSTVQRYNRVRKVRRSAEYAERRAALILLSQSLAKDAEGVDISVNQLLMEYYSDEAGVTTEDWDTFHGWKREGFKVRKGAKGFSIWGRPKVQNVQTLDCKTGELSEKDQQYFPIAYVFNCLQVEEMTAEEYDIYLQQLKDKEEGRKE